MPGSSRRLVPQPGERGLASADPGEVAALLDGAWGGLLSAAEHVDLRAASRLPGWSAHDVLAHLGAWDDAGATEAHVADARTGRVRYDDDVNARNAALVAEHHDASREELLGALQAARRRAAAFLSAPDADVVGLRWVSSRVGDVPLTGLLAAQGYELAVHVLDLTPAGAPPPAPEVLDAGVAAVVDVTGALAARRGLDVTFAVVTPSGRWATGTAGDSWTTTRIGASVPARALGWPAVEGPATDVLDAVSGRVLGAQLLLTRRLRLHDVPGLLRLLPALDAVPELPGGSALRTVSRSLGQAGRLVGRVGAGVGAVVARRRAAG